MKLIYSQFGNHIFKFFIMLLLLQTTATANNTININDRQKVYDEFQVEYIQERSGEYLDIEDIKQISFKNTISNKISLGYNQEDTWFHFKVQNTSKKEKNMVLLFTEVFHKTVNLYIVESNETTRKKNGLRIPIKKREIRESQPSFLLPLKAGEAQDIYLNISTTYGLFGEIQLKTQKVFEKDIQTDKYIYTAYFSAIIIIILYNLILFLYLRENLYFYYITYVVTFILWAVNYKGLLLPYINIHVFNFIQLSIPIFLALLILFSQSILETKQYFKRIHTLLIYLIYLCVIGFIWMSISLKSGFIFINFIALPIFVLLVALTLWAYYKKRPIAKIYLPALSIYMIGLGILGLLTLGVLPYSVLFSNAALIAALIEIILFSLLLAYRINLTRIESLKSKEKLIQQQKTERRRLEDGVNEKTQALKRAKNELEEELEKKATLEQHLKHLASTDSMTELFNRRAFFDICDTEIKSAQYHKRDLTVLILDIDHFKKINDTHGHDAGDKVIVAISKIMNESMRTSDFIARIGGEEFSILMPHTEINTAYQIADRLRQNIAKCSIDFNQESLEVTVSIGLSRLKHNDEDIHMLLKRADAALYGAKENGRNKVYYVR